MEAVPPADPTAAPGPDVLSPAAPPAVQGTTDDWYWASAWVPVWELDDGSWGVWVDEVPTAPTGAAPDAPALEGVPAPAVPPDAPQPEGTGAAPPVTGPSATAAAAVVSWVPVWAVWVGEPPAAGSSGAGANPDEGATVPIAAAAPPDGPPAPAGSNSDDRTEVTFAQLWDSRTRILRDIDITHGQIQALTGAAADQLSGLFGSTGVGTAPEPGTDFQQLMGRLGTLQSELADVNRQIRLENQRMSALFGNEPSAVWVLPSGAQGGPLRAEAWLTDGEPLLAQRPRLQRPTNSLQDPVGGTLRLLYTAPPTLRGSMPTADEQAIIDAWVARDVPRVQRALALAGDVVSVGGEIGIGVTLVPFYGVGLPIIGHGLDRGYSKLETHRTGTPQMSWTAETVFHGWLGWSKQNATLADDLAGDLGPLGALGVRGAVLWWRGPGLPAPGVASNAQSLARPAAALGEAKVAGVVGEKLTTDELVKLLRAGGTAESTAIAAELEAGRMTFAAHGDELFAKLYVAAYRAAGKTVTEAEAARVTAFAFGNQIVARESSAGIQRLSGKPHFFVSLYLNRA